MRSNIPARSASANACARAPGRFGIGQQTLDRRRQLGLRGEADGARRGHAVEDILEIRDLRAAQHRRPQQRRLDGIVPLPAEGAGDKATGARR